MHVSVSEQTSQVVCEEEGGAWRQDSKARAG